MARRIIWNGSPGEVWTNTTDKVRYQFIATLQNTCGVCLQYHMAIGPWWGIPLHHNCRCRQVAFKPGANAPNAFVDFRELLDGMPHDQQVAAIGASNYRLLKEGAVGWKDIVTPQRVRTLREVMSVKKLSMKRLINARIKPRIAAQAHSSAHSAEHELVAQHRKELSEKIKAAGLSQEQLVKELSGRLAAKVRIGPGPPGLPAWPGGGGSHAAELAQLLKKPLPSRPA